MLVKRLDCCLQLSLLTCKAGLSFLKSSHSSLSAGNATAISRHIAVQHRLVSITLQLMSHAKLS